MNEILPAFDDAHSRQWEIHSSLAGHIRVHSREFAVKSNHSFRVPGGLILYY